MGSPPGGRWWRGRPPRRCRRSPGGPRDELVRPGGVIHLTIDPPGARELRPTSCSGAAAGSGAPSRGDERPADATKVSAALEPPQAARAIRPRSRRVCDARCTPIPRPTPQLTGGLVRPRRSTILPERCRTASHDRPERSELLYHRPRVGADPPAPSWRRWGSCARSPRAWCPWRARGGRPRPRARRCGSGGGARVGARRCGAGRRVGRLTATIA